MDNCLDSFKYIAVDTEGFAPDILGISVAHTVDSIYFPLSHREDVNIDEEVRARLQEVLTKVPYRIFHNAGHDLAALPYLFDLPFICTMVMGHMVDENVMSKSLDYMHKYYCGGEGKKKSQFIEYAKKTGDWHSVPFQVMNEYASWDAQITMELFQQLLPKYKEQFGAFWSD